MLKPISSYSIDGLNRAYKIDAKNPLWGFWVVATFVAEKWNKSTSSFSTNKSKNPTFQKFFKIFNILFNPCLVQAVLLEGKAVKLLLRKRPARRRWLEKRPISWWDASPRPFDHEACALLLNNICVSKLKPNYITFKNNPESLLFLIAHTNVICKFAKRWQITFANDFPLYQLWLRL